MQVPGLRTSDTTIAFTDVLAARQRLAGKILQTPLRMSPWLSELTGAKVYFKLENLQITGSFKFRGALNSMTWACENHIPRIFTASSGNHGLGVAEAARLTGIDTTICVPVTISPMKRKRLQSYNVGLIEHGEDCEATEGYARRLCREKKAHYISPYNDPEVMAGQGTVALEMLEAVPDLSTLVVAVGGGGLIGGIGVVAKAINPKIRVIGAVAANSPVMKVCVQSRRILPVFIDKTIADGIAGNIEADSMTFPVVQEVVDEWIAIEESDIRDTIFQFLDHEGMIIEGAAAVAAAVLKDKHIPVSPNESIGVVICGGNIAPEIWHAICLTGLSKST